VSINLGRRPKKGLGPGRKPKVSLSLGVNLRAVLNLGRKLRVSQGHGRKPKVSLSPGVKAVSVRKNPGLKAAKIQAAIKGEVKVMGRLI
jgi:hypothetical protein